MTAAIRATILVIVALAGGVLAIGIGIATRPAIGADDPGSFWREELSMPAARPGRVAGRARLMHRRMRLRHVETRTAEIRRERVRVVGPASPRGAFVIRHALATPSGETPAAFVDRMLAPPPLEFIPPMRAPRHLPPPRPLEERKDERKPGGHTTRMLCLAAVVVAVLGGGVLSSVIQSQRGQAHAV